MDETQLRREYDSECMYRVNPPNFETWKRNKEQREQYYARQESIAKHPPDEDAWNK